MLKKFVFLSFAVLLVIFIGLFFNSRQLAYGACELIDSKDYDVLQKAREDCQRDIDARMSAQNKNKEDLAALEKNLATTKKLIQAIELQLNNLEKEILQQEIELEYQQEIFAARVRDYYKKSRGYSLFALFLASSSANDLFRQLSYRQSAATNDKKIILQVSQELKELNDNKVKLETNNLKLNSAKNKLDQDTKNLASEVQKVEDYFGQVQSTIAALSAKQQALLAEKFASLPVPLLAYTSLRGCSSDIGKDSGFSPRFGFFSLGIPNKTGLNQYGAKGRAEAGQTYEQILQAYYDNFQIVDYGSSFNIIVNGENEYRQVFNNESMNIEDYLKHLYEMPPSWTANNSAALKAQAIAARSYALARTNNGQNSIPPNQSGQVVKKEINDGNWQGAVDATRGKVMVYNGSPISAWYSSTHGGFVLKSGEIGWNDTAWTKHAVDAGSANSLNDLLNSAYDKSSPWFYCDWGYRKEYNSTAWLKEEEVVDIVNAYILWQIDNSTIIHLSQTDKSIPDTWSTEKVRGEISVRGGSYISSISSIGVDWDGSGISKTIRINGKSFDAQKFKNMFNLRAPGNIQIKPTCQPDSALNCAKMYGLYNVVKE